MENTAKKLKWLMNALCIPCFLDTNMQPRGQVAYLFAIFIVHTVVF